MNVWRQTGRKPKELENLVEIPDSCIEAWGWFIKLNRARSGTGFGLNPLTYSDIAAFFRLQQIVPEVWEVELIEKLDRTVMSIYAEKQASDSKKSSKK
jgi:hypothetical protein